MTDGTGLTGEAAALNIYQYIVFSAGAGKLKRLANHHFEGLQTEIIVHSALIDGDIALAGNQSYAGNSGLSSAGAPKLELLPFFILPYLTSSMATGF